MDKTYLDVEDLAESSPSYVHDGEICHQGWPVSIPET